MFTPNTFDVGILISIGVLIAFCVLAMRVRWKYASPVQTSVAERRERASWPKVKDRIRILVPIPEQRIEPGALGRVKFIYTPADDCEFFIEVDGFDPYTDGMVMFTENELWQLEVVEESGR